MVLKLGNVNATVRSRFTYCGKAYEFDGTTLDLAKRLDKLGAEIGDQIWANYGGMSVEGLELYVIVKDARKTTNGKWVQKDKDGIIDR